MRIKYKILLMLVIIFSGSVLAQEYKNVLSLRGKWKFSIGDDKKWADFNFDDKNWEEIYAPSSWEDQGFHGYNGYAWYRKHFYYKDNLKGRNIYLQLGDIDDVDQVYVNGKLVGFTGSFPPNYRTAYNIFRNYPIPESYLKENSDNVIAVRVYDGELSGGILYKNIGIYTLGSPILFDVNLEGEWKFKPDDIGEAKEPYFNDSKWGRIIVPGYWESQGYADYDGYAWYRKKFYMPENLKGKKIMLCLGKIDDVDQVFINGKIVGQTGDWNGTPEYSGEDYQKFRAYYVPEDKFNFNKENVITIRVYDGFQDGGIYQGPIGIMSQDKYSKFWTQRKNDKNFFDWLFQ
ncbi:MAG TPA: beta galactosidase jelly roll domain-containing protein [Ignavibacteriaceae bacterium]|nr:beta galactosidase jelly roll domain-containing protein [Ignavibacteriaceae bacterium]